MIGLGGTYANHFLRGYSLNTGLIDKNEVIIVRPIKNFLTCAMPTLVRMLNDEKNSASMYLSQMLQAQTMRSIIEKIIEHYIWEIYSIDSSRATDTVSTIVSGAKRLDANFDLWCMEVSRLPHIRLVDMDRVFVSVSIVADVAHIRIYNSNTHSEDYNGIYRGRNR